MPGSTITITGRCSERVEPYLQAGTGVILDIDVQGASQVRSRYPDNVSIFVRAGSIDSYEQRLRTRGTKKRNRPLLVA